MPSLSKKDKKQTWETSGCPIAKMENKFLLANLAVRKTKGAAAALRKTADAHSPVDDDPQKLEDAYRNAPRNRWERNETFHETRKNEIL